ncbi:hypothetical protein KIN20_030916 [Parelaphostrongylus tenuis]|uniref:Uncharacterized protein n=1 Tax=Parelaphostrongylus tenuis TaxID=148309 RepID=A0AAD5R4S6_PARTN|nr:hypothetical protein KIN20_030916 [Parelaphostrongylus tenuis]
MMDLLRKTHPSLILSAHILDDLLSSFLSRKSVDMKQNGRLTAQSEDFEMTEKKKTKLTTLCRNISKLRLDNDSKRNIDDDDNDDSDSNSHDSGMDSNDSD